MLYAGPQLNKTALRGCLQDGVAATGLMRAESPGRHQPTSREEAVPAWEGGETGSGFASRQIVCADSDSVAGLCEASVFVWLPGSTTPATVPIHSAAGAGSMNVSPGADIAPAS